MTKIIITFFIGSIFGTALSSIDRLNSIKPEKDTELSRTFAIQHGDGKPNIIDCPALGTQLTQEIEQQFEHVVLPKVETTIQQQIANLSQQTLVRLKGFDKISAEDEQALQLQKAHAEQILSSVEETGFIDEQALESFDIAVSQLPAKEKYQLDLELARKINSGQVTFEE